MVLSPQSSRGKVRGPCLLFLVPALCLLLLAVGCLDEPVEPDEEFEICRLLLETYFIFQDDLPPDPYVYDTPGELYESVNEPYTHYVDPSYAEAFLGQFTTETPTGGVGWEFDTTDGVFVISDVVPNSPGDGAGLQVGDTLLTVGGDDVAGHSLEQLYQLVTGTVGDTRVLGIRRNGENLSIEVTLDTYLSRSVYADSLDSSTAYIALTTFADSTAIEGGTAEEFRRALNTTEWAEYTILDLRDNLGGMLEQSYDVAGEFVPQGTAIIKVHERDLDTVSWVGYTRDTTRYALDDGKAMDREFCVLMNGYTASASEILVSCLHANRPDISTIGSTTYGKARGQILWVTLNGGVALVTCILFSPVAGPEYDIVGIEPNQDLLDLLLDAIEGGALAKLAPSRSPGPLRGVVIDRLHAPVQRVPLCVRRGHWTDLPSRP